MRPLNYWFRVHGASGARAWAARSALSPERAAHVLRATADDDRRPSARMLAAAAHLRGGDISVGEIAHLTGVPAALVELMKQTTAAGAIQPEREDASHRRASRSVIGRRRSRRGRLSVGAFLLSVVIVCSVLALALHRPVIELLGAAAAMLALLGCHVAARQRRR